MADIINALLAQRTTTSGGQYTDFVPVSEVIGTSPSLVAGNTGFASANTAAIQAALTIGGLVNITQPGTIWLNGTLTHGSNTTLVLGPNTTLKLVPGADCRMLQSSAAKTFLNGGLSLTNGTVVTLTQGTYANVNVNWAAHGLAVDNGVWLAGNTVSCYNGVFRIITIVDANNFTIYTPYRSTSAPSGTSKAVQAVQNFNLYGGTWDSNGANQIDPFSPSIYAHCIIVAGMMDCTAENVNSINSIQYQFAVQCVHNWRANNIKGIGRDLVQITGPATTIRCDGVSGYTTDDFFALGTNFNLSIYGNLIFNAIGDVIDVTAVNLDHRGTTGSAIAIHLYPSDNEVMDQIHFDQVSSAGAGASTVVQVNCDTSLFSHGYIGRLSFRNVNASASASLSLAFSFSTCEIDHLIIQDCTFVPSTTLQSGGNGFLKLGSGANWTRINTLLLERIRTNGWPSTSGQMQWAYINGATLTRLIMRDCVFKGGTGTSNLLCFESTLNSVKEILVDGGSFDTTVSAICQFDFTLASGTPNITFRNLDLSGNPAYGVATTAVINYHLRLESTSVVFSTSLVWTNQSNTIKISSSGDNDPNAATLVTIAAGAPVITLYGYDIKYDAGLLATTKGQYFYHSSAVGGRNAANQQGPCIAVDGTHFYALGTGAGGVNTLVL